MGLLAKITSAFTGGLADGVADIADRFIETADEKRAFKLAVQQEITKRTVAAEQTVQAELDAKGKIMEAEMNQDDLYTKRARPTLLYSGLVMIFINYIFVPTIQTLSGSPVEPFELPTEFWVAWGGVAGIYSLGRSAEKRGAANKVVRAITGKKKLSLLE